MKNELRTIEFTSMKMGANIKFKVEVKIKESFLQRLANVFKPSKTVTVWMEESQASSASNYLYNEIKKLKKTFVVKNEEPKADWEINVEKTIGPKADTKSVKKSAKPVLEGSSESSKPKRNYKRKPKKDQSTQSEN